MKAISRLCTAIVPLLFTGFLSFAQVSVTRDPNEPSEDEFEPQALSLEWKVIEDFGYTLKGYPVGNMMDGNPATAWAGSLDYIEEDGTKVFDDSKVYGDGILGFKIEVRGSRVSYLTIIAGYAKSESTFRNNSIPTEIAVYDGRCGMNDGGEFIDALGRPAEPLAVGKLERSTEEQMVELCPCLEGTGLLWFVIRDVAQGARYNDLCISELAFFGRQ